LRVLWFGVRPRRFCFLFPATVVVLFSCACSVLVFAGDGYVSGDDIHVRLAFVLTAEFLICMLLQVGFWLSAAKNWLRLVSVKP
jgi:hypothetical protein